MRTSAHARCARFALVWFALLAGTASTRAEDFSGAWVITANGWKFALKVEQKDDAVTGTMTGINNDQASKIEGKVSGNKITSTRVDGAGVRGVPAERRPDREGGGSGGGGHRQEDRRHLVRVVRHAPTDLPGRAFLLEKVDPGTDPTEGRYACFLGAAEATICECRGHAATGACQHLAALAELVRAGHL